MAALPGLLRAWAPPELRGGERMPVRQTLVVGRSTEASWRIADEELSGRHFEMWRVGERLALRDLDSTNGTAVNGEWALAPREVEAGDLVRAGRCLFVVHDRPMGTAPPSRTTAAVVTSPADRLAQAPARFAARLKAALHAAGLEPLPVLAVLRTDDLEALTLLGPSERAAQEREAIADAFVEAVRSIEDPPAAVLHHLVLRRHPDSPVFTRLTAGVPEAPDDAAAYERRREIILELYREVAGDLQALERLLRQRGIPVTRRWLSVHLERWGGRAMRGLRKK
ncbi:MAG: FHA domain-containing protein [Deltaproteobacteria bacterium]|nr:FHA domain-containing protein [Deltaproteobacteria bacterium]